MNCARVREEIKAYIDGELGSLTRRRVARHIANCDECRREMHEMAELTNEVRTASNVTAPQGLKDKVLGNLAFQPASGGPRGWSVARGLAVGAAGLIGVVLFAAMITPVFFRAKESSSQFRYLAAQRNMAPAAIDLRVAKDSDTRVTGKVAESSAPAPAASVPQMIIKTADLGVRVRSFQRASDEAVLIAKSSGGYVTDTSATSDQGIPTEGSMTLRVPVDAFERTLNRLAKLGTVTARSITGRDVTGESIDLESRLRNLRAEERQYLEIMNRARRIPDVVTVTSELTRVRGEIEEAQGRLKYLKTSSAMSTINLSLTEKKRAQPYKSSIESTFGSAIASLVGTLSGLASVSIWLVVYSPFWALPIAIWLYARKRAVASA